MAKITQARIYWDSQDPVNEGWAWEITRDDNSHESGEWNEPCDTTVSGLEDAVVSLAYQHGVEIERGDVAVELVDGGYGIWTA